MTSPHPCGAWGKESEANFEISEDPNLGKGEFQAGISYYRHKSKVVACGSAIFAHLTKIGKAFSRRVSGMWLKIQRLLHLSYQENHLHTNIPYLQARGFHLRKNTRTIVTISSFQAVVPNTGPQQFYGSFFHRMGAENLPPPAAPKIIHPLNIRRKWVDWMFRTAFIASLCVWGVVLII